jgi:hypothetical protein
VQGVLDAGLLLFHLDLGRGADVDLGHAAGELGEALLELLAVVVAGGRLDLVLDRSMRPLMSAGLAGALDDGAGVLVDDDRLARPSSLSWSFSRLMPRSSMTAVPPVRIAMSSSMALRRSPKPGALTAAALEHAAELVEHERGEGLALDVLGDDEQRLAGLGDLARASGAGP